MLQTLIEPFTYLYMATSIGVAGLVGGLCGFLSAYVMLKGWSLMGDALSHSVVPGVVGAHLLGWPLSLGAFGAGGLAAGSMLLLGQRTGLKEDAIIGIVFTGFFGLGLFMNSLSPLPFNVDAIIFGQLLTIAPGDLLQLALIGGLSLAILLAKWKDLLVAFFDESHARTIGLNPDFLKALFFVLLAATCVAALQTVGAFLVIALLITPGATAYLLTDHFPRLIALSAGIGAVTAFVGAYASYFLDGATGGIIVCLQTLIFLAAYLFAPKYGRLATRRAG